MQFEDMALYRTIPEAIVVDITDIPMISKTFKQTRIDGKYIG